MISSTSSIVTSHGKRLILRSLMPSSSRLLASFPTQTEPLQSLNYASEQDTFFHHISKDDAAFDDMVYSLSFSSRSKAASARYFSEMPNAMMRQQLLISEIQGNLARANYESAMQLDDAPLPRTMEEAMQQKNRAIVITETSKPFRVVEVNQAWEGLCGFSLEESFGKSLGALLKGPETDPLAVTSLVAQLLRGEEAGAILTNYTKDKRRFRNRLRVGPLMENSKVTHYVGVLQEVRDGM